MSVHFSNRPNFSQKDDKKVEFAILYQNLPSLTFFWCPHRQNLIDSTINRLETLLVHFLFRIDQCS